jgi:hypothetical protein
MAGHHRWQPAIFFNATEVTFSELAGQLELHQTPPEERAGHLPDIEE